MGRRCWSAHLDVTVYAVLGVQVDQRPQHLAQHSSNVRLLQRAHRQLERTGRGAGALRAAGAKWVRAHCLGRGPVAAVVLRPTWLVQGGGGLQRSQPGWQGAQQREAGAALCGCCAVHIGPAVASTPYVLLSNMTSAVQHGAPTCPLQVNCVWGAFMSSLWTQGPQRLHSHALRPPCHAVAPFLCSPGPPRWPPSAP
jgi:hypothetical protein